MCSTQLLYRCVSIATSVLHSLTYSWLAFTWLDGHVGVQNKDKMPLAFSITIEPNYQKTFLLLFSTLTWRPWRHVQAKNSGSFCRYRKALCFWSLGISLYLKLFCFLSFVSFVSRNFCCGTCKSCQNSKHLCQMMARYRVFVSFFFC